MASMAEHTVEQSAVVPPTIEEPWGDIRLVAARPSAARAWIRTNILSASIERRFLYVLLLLFLAKGIVMAIIFPPFTGHDEVAHYAYLQYVAVEHRVPIVPDLEKWRATHSNDTFDKIPTGLWKYCSYVTSDWYHGCNDPTWKNTPVWQVSFAGKFFPSGWVYTANHPPLYYVLMTPLYWLSQHQSPEIQLRIMRFAAIPFGLLTVLFAFLTTRVLFPRDQFLLVAVPTFVALQPQISYESAMLNNDILAICVMSAILYVLVRGLRNHFRWSTCVLVGALLGIGLISKTTTVTAAPIIALAMVLGLGWKNYREWVAKGAVVGFVTLLFAWPWYLFMWLQYHDLTALKQIRALQYWNYGGGKAPTILNQLFNARFAWARWKETWGEFGWRLIPLNTNLLNVLWYVSLFAVAGLVVFAIRVYLLHRHDGEGEQTGWLAVAGRAADPLLRLDRVQWIGLAMMLATCVVAYYAILQFGTEFSLTQARYYFPAINAGSLLLIFGLRAWFPVKWHPYIQTALFAALILLNVIIFTQYVIPYWNPNV